jgi:hypothetical protein
MIFTVRAHVVEWFATDLGMTVRSENYNQKDKLQGYTVLSSFRK